jgi:predicted nuclease with TOPRIM domain
MNDKLFDAIKQLINVTVEEKLDEHGLSEVSSKIDRLPTKDEFYTKMDELIGEVRDNREEQTVLSGQVSELRDRVDDLEADFKAA